MTGETAQVRATSVLAERISGPTHVKRGNAPWECSPSSPTLSGPAISSASAVSVAPNLTSPPMYAALHHSTLIIGWNTATRRLEAPPLLISVRKTDHAIPSTSGTGGSETRA